MSRHIVICGAGSAGCALAARLSEDPEVSVTLVEAGPDYPSLDRLPEDLRSAGKFGGPPHDWNFVSAGAPMPRGRVVGGSSAINGTNALRALPADFARWQGMGADEWGWEAVLPYFRKLEDDPAPGDWHGQRGPTPIHHFSAAERTPLTVAFVEACRAAGHPYVEDLNGPDAVGVGTLPMNQVDGIRQSAAVAYLTPAVRGRPNLEVRADATVDRVDVRDGHARAVMLASGERIDCDTAILSAGSYCSPTILLRSGIGPADALGTLGIPIVHANDAVGANLRDHPFVAMAFATTTAYEHVNPPLQALVHVASVGSGELDLAFIPMSPDPAIISHLLPGLGSTQVMFIGISLLRPYSVGHVALTSRDADAPPLIVNDAYAHPEDLGRMVDAVRRVRTLVGHPALARLVADEVFPGAELTDAVAIADAVLAVPTTQNHPIGTCSMGPAGSRWGVVDQRGKVHGVEDLYVIDASIIPALPSVPLNMTTIMLAERCADLLRA